MTSTSLGLVVAGGAVAVPLGGPLLPEGQLSGLLSTATTARYPTGLAVQPQIKYKVSVSRTGEVTWQVLVNGKPFLNRPSSTFQASCSGKSTLIGADRGIEIAILATKQKMTNPVAAGTPAPNVRITYRPLINFHAYSRPGSLLQAGPGRVFTVYEIDTIDNQSDSPYLFRLDQVRVDSGQDPDDFYGSSNSPISYYINQERPLYLSPVNQVIELQRKESASSVNLRFVVNADDVTAQTPNWRPLGYLPAPDTQIEAFYSNSANVPTLGRVTAADLPGTI